MRAAPHSKQLYVRREPCKDQRRIMDPLIFLDRNGEYYEVYGATPERGVELDKEQWRIITAIKTRVDDAVFGSRIVFSELAPLP